MEETGRKESLSEVALNVPDDLSSCSEEDLFKLDTNCTGLMSNCAPLSLEQLIPPDHDGKAAEAEGPGSHGTCLTTLGRLAGPLTVFSIVCLLFMILGRHYLSQLLNWLHQLPLLPSICIFIVLFTIISFPFGFGYIILNMAAGYLYGFLRGQTVVMVAVAVGFTVAFILCRSLLRNWASQYMTSPALVALMKVIEGPHGFKVIFLTRFTPTPFGLQNTLFAITNVSFAKAFFGSTLGLFPTQLINSYMGSTVRSMQEVLADRADGYIVLSIQVVVSVFLSLYLVRKARQELVKLTPTTDVETGETNR